MKSHMEINDRVIEFRLNPRQQNAQNPELYASLYAFLSRFINGTKILCITEIWEYETKLRSRAY